MSPKPNIVVLDGYTLNPGDNPWDEVAALGDFTVYERTPAGLIVERARDADILLTNKTPLTAQTLAALPRTRFIAALATGYDVVDAVAAAKHCIPVSNVPGYGVESVAQFVMAQLLTLARRVETHDRLVRAGEWTRRGEFSFWEGNPIELSGLTLGVVGFGAIGRRVAELALCFGMRVVAYAPRPKQGLDSPDFAFAPLEAVFAAADAITLHCPSTPTNEGFVNAALLAGMKPGGFFVNTARGKLVNEADLAEALNTGHLAGAALDVLAVEPPAPDNPLLAAKNCFITPHLAWASLSARKRLTAITAENIRAFLAGQPQNVVNADYLAETC